MHAILRQKIGRKNISLYIDYYKGGLRKYEFLKLYLHKEPENGKLTRQQKLDNDNTLALAESIRSKRYFELQNTRFGLFDFGKMKSSFIKYFEKFVEKKFDQTNDNSNWKSALLHLKKFAETDIAFEE